MSIPYMPFYVTDYEADTMHLTAEQDGLYMRLLRLCWKAPDCTIPADESWIMGRLRVDAETFERSAKPVLKEFFKRRRKRLFSPRLSDEHSRIKVSYENRRSASLKGVSARKALRETKKGATNGQPLVNAGLTNQNQNHKPLNPLSTEPREGASGARAPAPSTPRRSPQKPFNGAGQPDGERPGETVDEYSTRLRRMINPWGSE